MDGKLNQDKIHFSSISLLEAFKTDSKIQQNNLHTVSKSIDEFFFESHRHEFKLFLLRNTSSHFLQVFQMIYFLNYQI